MSNQDHDITMEIESLLKLFNINSLRDISLSNQNNLAAMQRQQSNSLMQYVELSYLNCKTKCLPIRQKTQVKSQEPQVATGPYSREIPPLH